MSEPVRLLDAAVRADLEVVAVRVAGEAARFVVEDRPLDLEAATKSSATDVVTVMDRRSEELIRSRLAALRPADGLLGEEGGDVVGTSGVTWVVDPIDGTTNYLYAIPAYAVSVAAVVGDPRVEGGWTPVAGAVVDAVGGTTWHARLGGGAFRRTAGVSVPVRASGLTDRATALVGTGFGYGPQHRERQARMLADVLPAVRDIRRSGSAALDLCALADGRLDAYYEAGVNAWDIAAGWLVVTEAGGVLGGLEADGSGPPTRAFTWGAGPGLANETGPWLTALAARHDAVWTPG